MARFTPAFVAALVLLSSAAFLAAAPTASAAPIYYDETVVSFDGTRLATTVFVPAGATPNSLPFVLMTHGWAGQRVATPTGLVGQLLASGYGVLTWDSRGFGASGGEVMLNSPDYEVKDVSAIITHLTIREQTVKKVNGDPVIGMAGGSYAGGIQLLAAAFDPRIDAIAPEITWHDLSESLAPNGVPKLYWTSLLLAAGAESSCVNARNGNPVGAVRAAISPINWATTGCQTSDLARYYAMVHGTNSVPAEVRDALLYRSPKTYMADINVPTLLIQGFPDTLFDVNQAVANFEGIKANGAPAKLWLYDGGHAHPEGPALPNTQAALIAPTVVNWFDRHLKGDTTVDTGAPVQYYAGGAWRSATSWPDPASSANTFTAGGIPSLAQGPVAGGPFASFTLPLAAGPTTLAGPASVSFRASGNNVEGILFFALAVQNANGTTVANAQVQPVRFQLQPGSENTTLVQSDLVFVEAAVPENSNLVLTISSTHRDYNGNRVPGFVNLQDVQVQWTTL